MGYLQRGDGRGGRTLESGGCLPPLSRRTSRPAGGTEGRIAGEELDKVPGTLLHFEREESILISRNAGVRTRIPNDFCGRGVSKSQSRERKEQPNEGQREKKS